MRCRLSPLTSPFFVLLPSPPSSSTTGHFKPFWFFFSFSFSLLSMFVRVCVRNSRFVLAHFVRDNIFTFWSNMWNVEQSKRQRTYKGNEWKKERETVFNENRAKRRVLWALSIVYTFTHRHTLTHSRHDTVWPYDGMSGLVELFFSFLIFNIDRSNLELLHVQTRFSVFLRSVSSCVGYVMVAVPCCFGAAIDTSIHINLFSMELRIMCSLLSFRFSHSSVAARSDSYLFVVSLRLRFLRILSNETILSSWNTITKWLEETGQRKNIYEMSYCLAMGRGINRQHNWFGIGRGWDRYWLNGKSNSFK